MPVRKKPKKVVINNDIADQKVAAWCIENLYKIYPTPMPECKGRANCDKFTLTVEKVGKKKVGKETYSYIESQNKIWELYHLIYNKRNEKQKK